MEGSTTGVQNEKFDSVNGSNATHLNSAVGGELWEKLMQEVSRWSCDW